MNVSLGNIRNPADLVYPVAQTAIDDDDYVDDAALWDQFHCKYTKFSSPLKLFRSEKSLLWLPAQHLFPFFLRQTKGQWGQIHSSHYRQRII